MLMTLISALHNLSRSLGVALLGASKGTSLVRGMRDIVLSPLQNHPKRLLLVATARWKICHLDEIF